MSDPDHRPTTADTGDHRPTTAGTSDEPVPPIVDWRRTAHRLRRVLLVIATGVVTIWVGLGIAGDGFGLARLGELAGLGLLVAFVAEVVVVGGSAVRGMLKAGERGDRLASADVSLLPPQLTRRRRR